MTSQLAQRCKASEFGINRDSGINSVFAFIPIFAILIAVKLHPHQI
jgi:hypothetical protein